MKKFSIKWKKSKKAKKQKKFHANAPSHIKHKMISVHLSKELSKKYSRRNFPLRKGDNVEIKRGKFKGKNGEVSKMDIKKLKAYIDGINVTKKDGSKVNVPLAVSNLIIRELNLDDKKRLEALERNTRKK